MGLRVTYALFVPLLVLFCYRHQFVTCQDDSFDIISNCYKICSTGDILCLENCLLSLETTTATTLSNTLNESSAQCVDISYTYNSNNNSLTCFYGTCDVCTDTCVCEQGWTGQKCDIECGITCTGDEICLSLQPFVDGFKCLPKPSTRQPCPITTLEPINGTRSYNVCEPDTPMRPFSERYCNDIFDCVYGVCKMNGSIPSCVCDNGADQSTFRCEHKCCLDCDVNGRCVRNTTDNTEFCSCTNKNYTGKLCQELVLATVTERKEETTWYLWLVGVCVVVLVILIALLVVAPYVMWRYRNLMVMKIVHYFQKYEDDDDREWDAFVSYKSSKEDEHFVVHTLFPKLENELGFKLHLHFRDFIPGDTISNNIIRAVQGSRRTIMIISPQYIQSEFIRFEYEMAQQEMMKRKHRMLPILLEDISECKTDMDPNLKVILNSVTYIEWPKSGTEKQVETFWKKVQFSLPKKRQMLSNMEKAANANVANITTHPNDIMFKTKNEISRNVSVRQINVYSTIRDSIVQEEVYDTINDDELDTNDASSDYDYAYASTRQKETNNMNNDAFTVNDSNKRTEKGQGSNDLNRSDININTIANKTCLHQEMNIGNDYDVDANLKINEITNKPETNNGHESNINGNTYNNCNDFLRNQHMDRSDLNTQSIANENGIPTDINIINNSDTDSTKHVNQESQHNYKNILMASRTRVTPM